MSAEPRVVLACLKWTTRPDLDVDGATDERFAGTSPADQAALEVALAVGGRLGLPVVAVSVGPPGAERALRDALACGATRAVRVDAPAGAATSLASDHVAAGLVAATALTGPPAIVVCGDHSLDRGTGSVPAYVAHELGVAQALGLVGVELAGGGEGDGLVATRRLDGGRRERLAVPLPCVVSVEGSVATLRRASLRRALDSASAPVEVIPLPPAHRHEPVATVAPFRPRARVVAAPAGDDVLARLRDLTDAGAAPARGETVVLPPPEAAARILDALETWGYLPR